MIRLIEYSHNLSRTGTMVSRRWRVVLLQGDGSELALRMVMTLRKDYTVDELQKHGSAA